MMRAAALGQAFDRLPGALRAACWHVLAGATFLSTMAIVRHIADDVPILVIVFWRSLVGIAIMLPWLSRRGLSAMYTRRLPYHGLRALGTFVSLIALMYAATMMPLADIQAIGFTRPIFTTLLAVVFLAEAMRARRWTATLIGFAGAMVVIRPGLGEVNPAVFLVLGALAVASGLSIVVKYLSRTDSPDTMTMYLVLLMTPMAFVGALVQWTWPPAADWPWVVAVGVLSTLSQRALARGYHAADASVVVSFDFLWLPIAATIGFVAFGEFPDIWVWVGAGVICAASVYLTQRETRAERVRREAAAE